MAKIFIYRFIYGMQVAQINHKQNPTFKNGFYNVTRELDSSVMLSRAVIDLCGCDIPWVIMANNNTERKEKSRKLFSGFAIAWLTPFVTLPLSNRFAMKHIGKIILKEKMSQHGLESLLQYSMVAICCYQAYLQI